MVFTTFPQPFLTGMILENVKMSPERYCFFEIEKDISLEMLALQKNILECEEMIFEVLIINKKKCGQNFTMWQSDELFTNISI